MGNRAIITTRENYKNDGAGIYLHWNGGRDSVEAFLTYCRKKGYRDPVSDDEYALAPLVQVVANFFGGATSVGIVNARCMAGDDNGVYIVGENWEIVGREEIGNGFIEQDVYPLEEMLKEIDSRMPESERSLEGSD